LNGRKCGGPLMLDCFWYCSEKYPSLPWTMFRQNSSSKDICKCMFPNQFCVRKGRKNLL